MGIKSTHSVTREFAIEVIQSKLSDISDLNDEDLADLLELVIHNGFYNFNIVSPEQLKQIESEGGYILDSMSYLPGRNNAW